MDRWMDSTPMTPCSCITNMCFNRCMCIDCGTFDRQREARGVSGGASRSTRRAHSTYVTSDLLSTLGDKPSQQVWELMVGMHSANSRGPEVQHVCVSTHPHRHTHTHADNTYGFLLMNPFHSFQKAFVSALTSSSSSNTCVPIHNHTRFRQTRRASGCGRRGHPLDQRGIASGGQGPPRRCLHHSPPPWA